MKKLVKFINTATRSLEPPEGPDIYREVGNILYRIGGAIGTRLESSIVTTEPITNERLKGEGWVLNYMGTESSRSLQICRAQNVRAAQPKISILSPEKI